MTIRKISLVTSLLFFLVILIIGGIGFYGISKLSGDMAETEVLSRALRNHMESGQMRAALHADFLAATRAAQEQNRGEIERLRAMAQKHARNLMNLVQQNDALPLPEDVLHTIRVNREKFSTFTEAVNGYIRNSSEKTAVPMDEYRALAADFTDIEATQDLISDKIEAAIRADRIASKYEANLLLLVMLGAGLTGLLICMGVYFFMRGSVALPIDRITRVIERLGKGDLTVEVTGKDLGNEIGKISRTVEVFKANAIAKLELEKKQKLSEAYALEEKRIQEDNERHRQTIRKSEAEAERRRVLHETAGELKSQIGGVVQTVSSAATELRASAESLKEISNDTSMRATAVAAATEEATVSVTTVSGATDQLLLAVNEIARKVVESAAFTSGVADRAQSTHATFDGLAAAARKIDNVTKIIQDIAWQTNLLALNATIEAARAGDAGKGFAVVATEIKLLADQTSKATIEISDQIGSMQTNTQDAVRAIKEISGQVDQINQISQSIAAAVEEQSVSTREIALNVQQASLGTQEVAKNILQVSHAASESGEAASQVLSAAGELSVKSEQLRGIVDRFLHKIREG